MWSEWISLRRSHLEKLEEDEEQALQITAERAFQMLAQRPWAGGPGLLKVRVSEEAT